MSLRHRHDRRRPAMRLLVAAFALWLPVATGQGGKAACGAAAEFAESLLSHQRPHLSCHGEKGRKADCCCKSRTTLRAAACGCHDGDPGFGVSAQDPMLAGWVLVAAANAALESRPASLTATMHGRGYDAPDSPPPQLALALA